MAGSSPAGQKRETHSAPTEARLRTITGCDYPLLLRQPGSARADFDQSLGDIFVVRTAGNVADPVALGSIEYAVDHIHSPLLVVLGHQKCGAVSAACSGEKMPSTNLDAIMKKIDPAVSRAKAHKADDLIESAIKENIHQSAEDVLANSEIVRNAVKAHELTVMEAEYEFDTGKVVRLNPGVGNN